LKGQNNQVKGFIAQQVETVLPSAVIEIDSILPICKGQVKVVSNTRIEVGDIVDCCQLLKGDEVVIGRDENTKDAFLVAKDVGDCWFEVCESSVPQLTVIPNYPQLYLHGKTGKMKTIDTNQILALCVSSLQQIVKSKK